MIVLAGRVVSDFVVKALKNEPLVIDGDGKHTRFKNLSLFFVVPDNVEEARLFQRSFSHKI